MIPQEILRGDSYESWEQNHRFPGGLLLLEHRFSEPAYFQRQLNHPAPHSPFPFENTSIVRFSEQEQKC